jgi:hypothetical protein
MRHRKLRFWGSAGVRRSVLIAAVAAAVLGVAAMAASSAFRSHSPAAVRPAATPAVSPMPAPVASPVTVRPDSELARVFRKYFHQQEVSGMTAWIKSGVEQRNQAILVQARNDAFPERNAALPADSAALAASARQGLAHPSPLGTAKWNKLMRDELTIARELPVPAEGDAATAEALVIEQDYLAFALASS